MAEPPAKKKRVHAFQESWRKGRPWLQFDTKENHMTCSLCRTFSVKSMRSGGGHDAWIQGCKRMKIEVVAEHERSKCHRDSEVAAKTKQGVAKQGGLFANQMAKRDDATVAAMQVLFWLIKENVALEKWNSLKGLLHHLGVQAISRLHLSGNASYTSYSARDDMLHAIHAVVQEKTKSAVAAATFCSVIADESTDVSNSSQLLMHLHCVRSGAIETRFGGLTSLEQRDALSVQNAMEAKCTESDVQWSKCHLGSDGASVFTGRHNGVMVRLMEKHDMVLSVATHCICHREALAAADAVKAVPYLVDVVKPAVAGIYRHFDNSTVREASLQAFLEDLNLPVLKLKEPKDVRWLSYDAAVSAFRRAYPAVLLELERQATDQRDAAAGAWAKKIKTYKFIASLHMLSDVLPHLVKLSKKFQARTVNFADLQPGLDAAMTAIQALKDAPGAYFQQTDTFIENLRSEDPDTDIDVSVTDARRESFDLHVRKAYLQALLDCLRQRFPALPLLSALSIFDPRNLPQKDQLPNYGNGELETLLEKLAGHDAALVDPDDCRSEWLG